MNADFTLPAPGLQAADVLALKAGTAGTTLGTATKAKAKAAAQNFEAVFLNSMFQQMYTGATGVWRSMLTDEYAKSFAKSGGIGIADQVYKTLIAQQEMKQ
jgi:flagellar protein FlgJ